MQTSVRQARMPTPAATESPKGGRTRRRGREGRSGGKDGGPKKRVKV